MINTAHRVCVFVSAVLASAQSSTELSRRLTLVHLMIAFEGKDGDVPAGRRSPQGQVGKERDACRGRKIKTGGRGMGD